MIDVLEILKITMPALASSGVVAYLFNRKAKRLEVYKEVANNVVNKMLTGMEDLQAAEKGYYESITKIQRLITKVDFTNEFIKQLNTLTQDLRISCGIICQTIDRHRIYITPLIPYGESGGVYAMPTRNISVLAELIEKAYKNNDDQKFQESIELIDSVANEAAEGHKEFRAALEKIIKKIINGRPVF